MNENIDGGSDEFPRVLTRIMSASKHSTYIELF